MATTSTVDLSKAAIRERSVQFAKRWQGTKSEASEKQTFWNELLGVFGIDRRQVAAFEELARRASTGNIGWIDLLYPGHMAVEHKSAGEDLDKALGQLFDYLPALHKAEFPWLLVVSDFDRFAWRNLDTNQSGEFQLAELPHNLEVFWWMAGHGASPFAFVDEEEANLVATSHMANLYDELLASGYDAHTLREWLTRILFCLFADDTDVWDRAGFHTYVARYTHADGHDLGPMLAQLFEVLDTPPEHRARTLDEDLAAFTYINGDLFANRLPMPSCNESVRNALLEACRFDWGIISPAIFGSMFQNVMQPAERRQIGAHYTTEQNILRTIRPLFLDDLEAELNAATTGPALDRYLEKLAGLTFLDPACGCGNFLVIAYRELRALETEALRRLDANRRRTTGQRAMDLDLLCRVNVAQFYGIEIEEFPARIARTALYLADHISNRLISSEFGELFLRFPIPASPHIDIANALRMDWNDLLPAEQANYVFGNPPFVGMSVMSPEQNADNEFVFGSIARDVGRSGRLDYVASWYAKAVDYLRAEGARAAFVSTNSITQGEQARSLGPFLASKGFTIDFAHRTFAWSSEARGTAHVHVVIIGFSRSGRRRPTLFDYPTLTSEPLVESAARINFYLVAAPDVYPEKRTSPFDEHLPTATKGCQATDWGHLMVDTEQLPEVLADPIAARYLRQFQQGVDLLSGETRHCLWLVDAPPADLRASRLLSRRLQAVHDARLTSPTASVRLQAETPALFTQIRQPSDTYLALPETSSSRRRVIPGSFLGPEVIAGNTLITFPGAPLWLFGVLQSAMWMAWLRTVGGRLKSDLRISPGLAYFAFPLSAEYSAASLARVEEAAAEVLEARSTFATSSLADLYEPLATPPALIRAHEEVDRAVDALFAPRRRFATDADRLALLFERYEALITSGQLIPPTTRRSRPRPSS